MPDWVLIAVTVWTAIGLAVTVNFGIRAAGAVLFWSLRHARRVRMRIPRRQSSLDARMDALEQRMDAFDANMRKVIALLEGREEPRAA